MQGIPEGLIVKPNAFTPTQHGDVLKPTYGNLDSLPAEFRVVNVYSAADSEEQGREVERPVEIAMIHSDKFSKVPLRVANKEKRIRSELSKEQEMKLAPLYERFKQQKDSTDTSVADWQAVTEQEKAFLAQLNIWSVEQLHSIPQWERYKLGPAGEELWTRAERHMRTKEEKKRDEATEEMLAVLEENKKFKERQLQLEEQMYKMQEQMASFEKKRSSTRKKVLVISEPTQEASA